MYPATAREAMPRRSADSLNSNRTISVVTFSRGQRAGCVRQRGLVVSKVRDSGKMFGTVFSAWKGSLPPLAAFARAGLGLSQFEPCIESNEQPSRSRGEDKGDPSVPSISRTEEFVAVDIASTEKPGR